MTARQRGVLVQRFHPWSCRRAAVSVGVSGPGAGTMSTWPGTRRLSEARMWRLASQRRGQTVWPTKLRCVSCRANDPGDIYGNGDGQFDVKDVSGAKFYTRFYHGRWMRG